MEPRRARSVAVQALPTRMVQMAQLQREAANHTQALVRHRPASKRPSSSPQVEAGSMRLSLLMLAKDRMIQLLSYT